MISKYLLRFYPQKCHVLVDKNSRNVEQLRLSSYPSTETKI